ncbi:hypothetical protein GCM10009743_44180 [Kribbella swartbergensis]
MTTRLTVATFNTRGLPLRGTRIAERFDAIADELDSGGIDLVCLQEVFAYRPLAHLRRGMPSFSHVAYRPSVAGPASGLVTPLRLRLAEPVARRGGSRSIPRVERQGERPAREPRPPSQRPEALSQLGDGLRPAHVRR